MDNTPDPESTAPQNRAPKRRGPPPNPLFHPLFLPVVLVAYTLWFFWDGFLTSDPDMFEHQNFNRIMFGITSAACLYFVPRGIREFKEDQAKAASEQQQESKPD